jgi:hypothetical protein
MEIAERVGRYPAAGIAVKQVQDTPSIAEGRRETIQPPASLAAVRGGNLLMLPTDQRREAAKPEHGDDAGRCSNGLSAKTYQAATPEDGATFRRWLLGIIVCYSSLLLISGGVAMVVDSNTTLTNPSSIFTAGAIERPVATATPAASSGRDAQVFRP